MEPLLGSAAGHGHMEGFYCAFMQAKEELWRRNDLPKVMQPVGGKAGIDTGKLCWAGR